MYSEEELTMGALRTWAEELSAEELAQKIDKLPSWNKQIELASLDMNSMTGYIARAFADLSTTIASAFAIDVNVRIVVEGSYQKIVRQPSDDELLNFVATAEYTRRLSANRKEKEEAVADAARPSAEVVE